VADVSEPAGIDTGVVPLRFGPRTWYVVVIDALAATVIALLGVFTTLNTPLELSNGTTIAVWLLTLALSLPLIVGRHWPIRVFSLVLVSAIVALWLGVSGAAAVLAIAVTLYPVALSTRLRRSATALGAALMGVTLTAVLRTTEPGFHFPGVIHHPEWFDIHVEPFSSLIFSWITIGVGWALGRSTRARRAYTDQIAEHRAQQAVSEERLRIAREMHDVVAHSIGVIVMKAAVANHVYDTRPEESREALAVIESISRAALTDIRRVLGSLRSTEEPDLAPSPDLDELPKLIENAQHADVQVELDRGTIPALPAAVQLSAYRIVQEALTNIIKHAMTPVRCTVRITAQSGELHLSVIDNGKPGRPVGTPGHGLIGMRERAALHHGTVVAGWQPNGGFAVHARLPYQVQATHE
jgi:signal transduction histidine kinase